MRIWSIVLVASLLVAGCTGPASEDGEGDGTTASGTPTTSDDGLPTVPLTSGLPTGSLTVVPTPTASVPTSVPDGQLAVYVKDAPTDEFAEIHFVFTQVEVHQTASRGNGTPSNTTTPSPSNTTSPSPTPSPTNTTSPTPSPSPSNTTSPSPTPSPTNTTSPTPTPTNTTGSPTPSPSPTNTTPTPSPTPTNTTSPTPSPSPTNTTSPSPTPTNTTGSPTPTNTTGSPTPSPTPTNTTPTPSPSPSPGNGTCQARWITVFQGNATDIDLLAMNGSVAAFLGSVTLEACRYTQVRIHVTAAYGIRADGTRENFTVSNNELKLVRSFQVNADWQTRLIVDFDLDRSIHRTGGPNGAWRVTPVVGKVCEQTAAPGSGPSQPGQSTNVTC